MSPHVGLLRIAAVWERAGHEVVVVSVRKLLRDEVLSRTGDLGASLAAHARDLAPDAVGVTSRCDTYPDVCAFLEAWAGIPSHAPVLLGGPHATAVDLETLAAFPAATFVVRGEGETTAEELAAALSDGRDPARVAGLALRAGGRAVRTPSRAPIADLDALPLPAYHLLDADLRRDGYPFASIDLGRGCPHHCAFCATAPFWSSRPRMRSATGFLEEARLLRHRYGTRGFYLEHDALTADRGRFLDFAREVAREAPWIRWAGSARFETVDDEILAAAAASGCWSLYFGIESGDPETLRLVRKEIDEERLAHTLGACDRHGVAAVSSFILGFPGESEAAMARTIELAARVAAHPASSMIQIHPLAPAAGSALVEGAAEPPSDDGASPEIAVSPFRRHPRQKRLVDDHPRIFPDYRSFPCGLPRADVIGLAQSGVDCLERHPLSTILHCEGSESVSWLLNRVRVDPGSHGTSSPRLEAALFLESTAASLPRPGPAPAPGEREDDSLLVVVSRSATVISLGTAWCAAFSTGAGRSSATGREVSQGKWLVFRRGSGLPIIHRLRDWEASFLESCAHPIPWGVVLDRVLAGSAGVKRESARRRVRYWLNEGVLVRGA